MLWSGMDKDQALQILDNCLQPHVKLTRQDMVMCDAALRLISASFEDEKEELDKALKQVACAGEELRALREEKSTWAKEKENNARDLKHAREELEREQKRFKSLKRDMEALQDVATEEKRATVKHAPRKKAFNRTPTTAKEDA